MRRLISFLLIALIVTPCIALAHPGKTDENGGHTDHSTGEYHYHHGYPAHQHKDTNGDGKKDCPYDFNDATDHHTGTSNTNNSNNSNNSNKTTSTQKSATTTTTNQTASTKNNNSKDWQSLLIFLAIILLPFVPSICVNVTEWVRKLICKIFPSRKKKDSEKQNDENLTLKETTQENPPAPVWVEFLNSPTISSAKFDNGTLYIIFSRCKKYAYFNVPEEIYQGLISASDKEAYYSENIYEKFPFGVVHN